MSGDTPTRSFASANQELIEAFARWLVAKNYSASTRYLYARDARAFAEFLASENLAAADHRAIRLFLSQDGPSPNAYQMRRCSLRSLFRFLEFAGAVRHSPVHRFRRPRLHRKVPRCLSEREVERLIASAASPGDRALLELLYASGLRGSEISNLKIRDLNLDSGTIEINCGKGNKDRRAIIGAKAVEALRNYIGRRKNGHVFLSSRGRRLDRLAIWKAVTQAARSAGFPGVHPHTLRHTFATVLLNRGADLRYVQELLGHARVTSTAIYTHTAIADLSRVYERCHPHAKGTNDGAS